ncbi:MAG: hypothetical protein QF812_03790 [Nitrososphaerales archaeon]|nr:hypothetical protein [Nitrososphaerales archaeon]
MQTTKKSGGNVLKIQNMSGNLRLTTEQFEVMVVKNVINSKENRVNGLSLLVASIYFKKD